MVVLSEFSLDGKVAFVTGAGRGLGLEIATSLAKAGAYVIINGRNRERLDRATGVIESIGGSVFALPLDVTDEAAVKKAFVEIREKYGCLDISSITLAWAIVADFSSLKWMQCAG